MLSNLPTVETKQNVKAARYTHFGYKMWSSLSHKALENGIYEAEVLLYVMYIVYGAWYNDLSKYLCTEDNLFKEIFRAYFPDKI